MHKENNGSNSSCTFLLEGHNVYRKSLKRMPNDMELKRRLQRSRQQQVITVKHYSYNIILLQVLIEYDNN